MFLNVYGKSEMFREMMMVRKHSCDLFNSGAH